MEEIFKNVQFTNIAWAIIVPLTLMVLDIVTGYYNAWKNKEVSSSKMRDGLGKKCAELCYIIVGVLINFAFETKAVMYFIVLYVCYMEVVSLIENCDKLGVPLPNLIKDKINNIEKI